MHESAEPEDRFPSGGTAGGAVGDKPTGGALRETELDSALQLLVERAQYITGATGTALALPQGEEMVCRASAGSSAPAVGARLQVRSGLTGESIARRQLLRCDNAESDPRVNLEACRALGIASIVVLPLLRRNGQVRGLFELFSDHPYAFEERDLIALERMADLTLTALDLAEQLHGPATVPRREADRPVESSRASSVQPAPAIPINVPAKPEAAKPEAVKPEAAKPEVVQEKLAKPEIIGAEIANPEIARSEFVKSEFTRTESSTPALAKPALAKPEPADPVTLSEVPPARASVPESMLRVQKCAACGFPVSDGRTLCLDCEKKDSEKKQREPRQGEQGPIVQPIEQQIEQQKISSRPPEVETPSDSAAPEEFVPAFLANYAPAQESWLANHVNWLALAVLILGILVAIVVFR